MSQQWGPGGGQYGGAPGGQYGGQPGVQPGGQYGQFGGQPGPYGGGQPGWNQQGGYRPQGGFGPQWGPPAQRFAPPPPKKSKLGRLFGVIALLALVALAGLVITNLTSDKSDVAYQNDDYKVPPPDKNPPPLPLPQTYEEAEQLIKSNALYTQTAPFPVRCDETKTINLDTASDAQAKEHFEAVMGCLMRVWNPPVTGAKYTLVRPTVTIYGSSITTKCGTSKINAFYCSADQQVYYSNRLAEGVPAVKGTPWGPDIVMAHEFGHAIQARTAILISAHALGQESGDEATDLEYSRRLETQADCFSGLYINAVARSQGITADDLPAIEATYVAIGDDTLTGKPNIVGNHGRGATREYWGKVGLSTSDVGKCNTFAAPASQVQ